jgi:MFS family permease
VVTNIAPVTEAVGRRWALKVSCVIFLLGSLLMTVATHQLSYICEPTQTSKLSNVYALTPNKDAGRVLTGLACGFITATVPSYIAELSIPSIRGILTGLFEVTYQIGSVIGFWINYGITQTMSPTSSTSWRIPMAVQLIPGGLLMVGCFFVHESPLWLMRNNKQEETNKTLRELRGLPVEHQCKSGPGLSPLW